MNRFSVISLIGEGSFGRVYKANRKTDNEIVAIKIITKVRKQKCFLNFSLTFNYCFINFFFSWFFIWPAK